MTSSGLKRVSSVEFSINIGLGRCVVCSGDLASSGLKRVALTPLAKIFIDVSGGGRSGDNPSSSGLKRAASPSSVEHSHAPGLGAVVHVGGTGSLMLGGP